MTKYKAKPVVIDGHTFPSQAEGARYYDLKLRERAGEIRNLELQPVFNVTVNGVKVCTYRGDFVYFEKNARVVEDVKGFKTPVYRLKKKLVEALHPGLKIVEISAGKASWAFCARCEQPYAQGTRHDCQAKNHVSEAA